MCGWRHNANMMDHIMCMRRAIDLGIQRGYITEHQKTIILQAWIISEQCIGIDPEEWNVIQEEYIHGDLIELFKTLLLIKLGETTSTHVFLSICKSINHIRHEMIQEQELHKRNIQIL